MKIYLLVYLIACFYSLTHSRLEEGTMKKCKRNSLKLGKCLIKRIESIRENLKKGMPEINVPPLEPFTIARVNNLANLFPLLKIRGYATDVELRGLGNFKIEKFKINSNVTAEATVYVPKLEIQAHYATSGSNVLAFIPLQDQSGQMTGTFYDFRAHLFFRAKLDNDSFEEFHYVNVPFIKAWIEFGPYSKFNLYPDSGILHKIAGSLLNLAPVNTLKLIKESINKNAAQILKPYVNKILKELPIQDVLSF